MTVITREIVSPRKLSFWDNKQFGVTRERDKYQEKETSFSNAVGKDLDLAAVALAENEYWISNPRKNITSVSFFLQPFSNLQWNVFQSIKKGDREKLGHRRDLSSPL